MFQGSDKRRLAAASVLVDLGPTIPPVRRVVTSLARRFYQVCVTIVADSIVSADLTPLQFAVLSHLNRRDGEPGIDQNNLAGRIGVERSHVSLLVEELESRGLVERRVNGADRRARVLKLSSKGERLYDRLRVAQLAANKRVLDVLAPHEQQVLFDLLIRILKRNGASARPGAGRRKRGSRQQASSKDRQPSPN